MTQLDGYTISKLLQGFIFAHLPRYSTMSKIVVASLYLFFCSLVPASSHGLAVLPDTDACSGVPRTPSYARCVSDCGPSSITCGFMCHSLGWATDACQVSADTVHSSTSLFLRRSQRTTSIRVPMLSLNLTRMEIRLASNPFRTTTSARRAYQSAFVGALQAPWFASTVRVRLSKL